MADRGPVRDFSTRPYLSDRLDTLLASLDPKVQRLKHAKIAKRYGKAKSWSWASWLTRRINEIQMVLWDQYPNRELPDDDAGHDDLTHRPCTIWANDAPTLKEKCAKVDWRAHAMAR